MNCQSLINNSKNFINKTLQFLPSCQSGIPCLSGPSAFFASPSAPSPRGNWQIGSWHHLTSGFTSSTTEEPLCDFIRRAYNELLHFASSHSPPLQICRLWHFLPHINLPLNGLETYRAFCVARHQAFFEHYGSRATSQMPAASAVGSKAANTAFIAFVASPFPCKHWENPAQTPAYDYPEIHSPKPPCFSRATSTAGALFISGTSSIRGHQTIHPHNLAGQLSITMENIEIILKTTGLSPAAIPTENYFATVFLRQKDYLPLAQEFLAPWFQKRLESVQFLEADICRKELLVEIELTLLATPGQLDIPQIPLVGSP